MTVKEILIVDDESVAIMICEKLMKVYDPKLEIKGITSPVEAIFYLEEHKPDIIFLDIRMPLMDGFAFLDAMQERNLSVPVILLTSSTSYDDQRRSEKYANVIRYQIKPLTVAKIGMMLAAA